MIDILTRGADGQVTVQGAPGGIGQLVAAGMPVSRLRSNDLLGKDWFKALDSTIQQVARSRMRTVGFLIENGLGYTIDENMAMATTILEWQVASDMGPATVSMDAATTARRDRQTLSLTGIPVPIVSQEFQLSARAIRAAETRGTPIDTSHGAIAGRVVAEAVESILFNGAAVNLGTYSLPGLTTHTSRNTGTFEATGDEWSNSGKTGEQILADVLSMLDKLVQDNQDTSRMMLRVPTAYWTKLGGEFKANGSLSILARLREIPGLDWSPQAIDYTGALTGHNVTLTCVNQETVDIIDGIQPVLLSWEDRGGLVVNFIVMAIVVPRVKADQAGNSGVAHFVNAS